MFEIKILAFRNAIKLFIRCYQIITIIRVIIIIKCLCYFYNTKLYQNINITKMYS